MILKCNCINAYQDKVHGKGNRVHTPMKAGKTATPMFRCTVCAEERSK